MGKTTKAPPPSGFYKVFKRADELQVKAKEEGWKSRKTGSSPQGHTFTWERNVSCFRSILKFFLTFFTTLFCCSCNSADLKKRWNEVFSGKEIRQVFLEKKLPNSAPARGSAAAKRTLPQARPPFFSPITNRPLPRLPLFPSATRITVPTTASISIPTPTPPGSIPANPSPEAAASTHPANPPVLSSPAGIPPPSTTNATAPATSSNNPTTASPARPPSPQQASIPPALALPAPATSPDGTRPPRPPSTGVANPATPPSTAPAKSGPRSTAAPASTGARPASLSPHVFIPRGPVAILTDPFIASLFSNPDPPFERTERKKRDPVSSPLTRPAPPPSRRLVFEDLSVKRWLQRERHAIPAGIKPTEKTAQMIDEQIKSWDQIFLSRHNFRLSEFIENSYLLWNFTIKHLTKPNEPLGSVRFRSCGGNRPTLADLPKLTGAALNKFLTASTAPSFALFFASDAAIQGLDIIALSSERLAYLLATPRVQCLTASQIIACVALGTDLSFLSRLHHRQIIDLLTTGGPLFIDQRMIELLLNPSKPSTADVIRGLPIGTLLKIKPFLSAEHVRLIPQDKQQQLGLQTT